VSADKPPAGQLPNFVVNQRELRTLQAKPPQLTLANKVLDYLLKYVSFWSKGLYPFVRGGQLRAKKTSATRSWIVVVGRQHYFESVTDYPVGDLGDVKKILKNRPWAFPFSGQQFDQIERLTPQSHRVTSWVIKDQVMASLQPRPLLVIPETACINALQPQQPQLLSRLKHTLVVANTSDGLISNVYQTDLSNGSAAVSRDNFFASVGLSEHANWQRNDDKNTHDQLLKGLGTILKTAPLNFVLPFKSPLRVVYPWKNALKLLGGLLVIYLFVTSAYLVGVTAWVDHRIERLRVQSEPVLELRQQVTQLQAEYSAMKTLVSSVTPMWVVWDLALDLADRGVTLRAVNKEPDGVIFFLSASKASEVMRFLSQDPRVAHADYAFPVTQRNSQQQFAVKVVFVPQKMALTAALDAVAASE